MRYFRDGDFFSIDRAGLIGVLARIHSHQLAHNRIPAKQTRRVRDPWEEQLLAAEDHPLRQLALKNDLAMIRHFDRQVLEVEKELQRQTNKSALGNTRCFRLCPASVKRWA